MWRSKVVELGPMEDQATDLSANPLPAFAPPPSVSTSHVSTPPGPASPQQEQGQYAAERRAFDALFRLVEITTELFGTVTLKHDYDPEYPSDRYLVFCVTVSADRERILALEDEWTRRVAKVEPKWEAFRLFVERQR
jgi:hypothetical protein